jgi:hypothetical protein
VLDRGISVVGRAWLFRGLRGTREIGSRTLLRRGQDRGQWLDIHRELLVGLAREWFKLIIS